MILHKGSLVGLENIRLHMRVKKLGALSFSCVLLLIYDVDFCMLDWTILAQLLFMQCIHPIYVPYFLYLLVDHLEDWSNLNSQGDLFHPW